MFYCGFCTKLLLFPLINIQKQNWDMLDQVAWGPCSVPEPPKGKWHCTWLVMLSVSAAWNVHICVHKPLHAMAKYALQCQTICALASLGCVRMLLGRDDNKEWGTVNSSSLSFKAITCRAWGVWRRQETDSTVLVIWSFLLSCAAVSTPAIPQGCPPAGSWCWTQGIKPGLIFCWIFLGRDWTWNQTGMSNSYARKSPRHLATPWGGHEPQTLGQGHTTSCMVGQPSTRKHFRCQTTIRQTVLKSELSERRGEGEGEREGEEESCFYKSPQIAHAKLSSGITAE